MYPNDLNVMEAIWRSIRIYMVEKNGKLCDKFDRNIDLICEYDPQGMKMKIFTGETKIILSPFLSLALWCARSILRVCSLREAAFRFLYHCCCCCVFTYEACKTPLCAR